VRGPRSGDSIVDGKQPSAALHQLSAIIGPLSGFVRTHVRNGSDSAYAGELRIGDVWTERTEGGDNRGYRVIAIAPGLAPIAIRVTASCVATGQRRMMGFFTVNRVAVCEEPT
jgi:hypothetical protein